MSSKTFSSIVRVETTTLNDIELDTAQDATQFEFSPQKDSMKELDEKVAKLERRKTKRFNISHDSVDEEDTDDLGFGLDKSSQIKVPRHWPLFTPVLILAQVALFVVCVALNGFEKPWINTSLGPSEAALLQFGAKKVSLIRDNFQVWRLISSFVLTNGILHLMLMIMWQLQVAFRLERMWAFYRMLPIYILSGIGGNLLSAVFLPDQVSVGPTSCITGLQGALLADVLINWTVIPNPFKPLVSILLQIIAFILLGLIPFIDNFANIGGLIVGFFTALALLPQYDPQRKRLVNMFVRLFGAIIVVIYFAAFFILLFIVKTFSCSVCYWINPTWDMLFNDADADQ